MIFTEKPSFIAEVSSNHNRDLTRCLQFIEAAATAGCQAVKFQLFRLDQLFAAEILKVSAAHRNRREWELPVGFLPRLADACHSRGMLFGCTPFDLKAVGQLAPHVDFLKISSYELTWPLLLRHSAATGLPIVVSTGMAEMDEVREAVQTLQESGVVDLTLVHCVSAYPVAAADCNLAAIETLRSEFGCRVGWSDHSTDAAVLARAWHRWGASVIEFHLDLDGQGAEYETGHCWLPDEIADTILSLRRGSLADGSGRKIAMSCELRDRPWRADPRDGLRPQATIRSKYARGGQAVAIVQARMGSSRLPGKVLRQLGGQPILWRVVERLRQVPEIEEVVVATSNSAGDDAIRSFCSDRGVSCFAGDEVDVLDRFYQTARQYQADPIIRITADCPFIDPLLISRLIDLYASGNYDHVGIATGAGASSLEGGRFPDGLDAECFGFSALEKAWHEADTPSDREHVTPFLWRNESHFKVGRLTSNRQLPDLRLTIDTEEDFARAEALWQALSAPERRFRLNAVLEALEEDPVLAARCLDQRFAQRYKEFLP